MRKYIAALLAAATLFTCTACGQKEEVITDSTPNNNVTVQPTLFTVGDVFYDIYTNAGCTGEDGDEDILNEYLGNYDLSVDSVILELEGSASTSIPLSRLLGDIGVKMSEVDWSTVSEVYTIPVFSDISSPTVNTTTKLTLTSDGDEFVDIISHYGVVDYWNLLTATYPDVDITADRPDESFITKLLYDWSTPDVESLYPDTCKYVADNTLEVKLNSSTNSYYSVATRNGFRHVSFYPYNSGKDGYLYMRDNFSTSDIPLWQAYFCAYAAYLQGEFDVSVTSGVINSTTDGVEIWWSPSTGYTLSLAVYESGLVRITHGTDDRYSDYIDEVTDVGGSASSTVKNALQDKLGSEFSMSSSVFESLVSLAQVMELPCADINLTASSDTLDKDTMRDWLDAAAIFNSYLKAVDKAHQSSITPYEFSVHLIDFACIGRDADTVTELKGLTELIASHAGETDPMSTASDINPDIINDYSNFTDQLLDTVGSKSYFMIEGYNSFMTNITYVYAGEDKTDEVEAGILALHENSYMSNLAEVIFINTINDTDFRDAFDGDYSTTDQNRVLSILDCINTYSFTSDSSVTSIVDCIMAWFAFGKSSVTSDNLYSINTAALADYATTPVKELVNDTELLSILTNIMNEAIVYADVQGGGTGTDIAKALLRKE